MARTPDDSDASRRRISGGFPGGPSRGQGSESVPPTRTVRTMDEVEAGMARRRRRIKERGRRAKAVWTAVGVGILAAAVGTGLGMMSHRTPEQIREESAERSLQDDFISREVNRTLLQLWKMEDVEAMRNRGRVR